MSTTSPTPDSGPQGAGQGPPQTAVGVPKVAARQGVLSALRSDPRSDDTGNPTPDRPGIRIYAPPVYRHHYDGARWSKRYGDTPTAAYACSCGKTGTATGARAVAALVTAYDTHRDACPLRNPQEGRHAA
ncbi:hypothetical protein [Streptomyces sp. NPDC046862]|uniref:hypothetical protein n=1 Tax=Streptomyces sp. NPDC046862 TaxID=3154603 RepID=UPI0034532E4F